ncbi:MAG: ORF6N domain-containing protein [Bacteroidia bacterium]|nr:ORF6N domain-containing protein [Bacteroidia bacterium]
MNNIVKFEEVEKKIIDFREQKVIIDCDVAELYGVETKRINEAVGNNPDKFPDGYILALTNIECNLLMSKFSTSIKGGKIKIPKAFTEKGLYMLATILKSERATQTTLAIIETFARIKNLSRNIKELSNMTDERKKKDIMRRSGEIITEIFDDDLSLNETETTIELNFAVLKFKHTIKRK